MSRSAFFSSDDIIGRKLDVELTGNCSNEELKTVYHVEQVTQWILNNEFLQVALQYPDELLKDAPEVLRLIQSQLPHSTVFILGDTSYGSCCVDEVGAQHYKADCIIHFGPACLSPTMRLPVFYVFGRSTLDVGDCVEKIRQECNGLKTILAYDTKYAYIVGQVFEQLQKCLPSLILSKLVLSGCSSHRLDALYTAIYPDCIYAGNEQNSSSALIKCGRAITLPEKEEKLENYSFIYLGRPDNPSVVNMMMNFNTFPFYAYNPDTSTCQKITLNTNKMLMKRYYLIERVKDAGIVGILVGTLGVARYRDILDHLKGLLRKAGKKTYTFVVGKLNPHKLGNFAEVELYVLVSCPESCLLDQSDFHCPIVSPFEVEVACNQAREWTGDYTTDFTTLLPGASNHIQAPDTFSSEEGVDVSLISNRIRVMGDRHLPEPGTRQDVVLRDGDLALAKKAENAGDFLSMRSWQGLEQKLGQTPVVKAVEGQTGIAASYSNEQDL